MFNRAGGGLSGEGSGVRTSEVTDEDLGVLFVGVMVHLDERQRRIVAGNVALLLGRGGITAVAEAAQFDSTCSIRGQSMLVDHCVMCRSGITDWARCRR